jgi:hypothetical protein
VSVTSALKWGFLTVGVVFVVVLVIAALTSPASKTGTAATGTTTPAIRKPLERFVLRGVSFEITRARTVERLVGRDAAGGATRAKGVFVIVDLTFRNVGEDPVTAFTADSGFLGGNGKTYGLDSGGATISGLPPRASGAGRFVFDVEPAAVRGGRLLLIDCGAPLLDSPEQHCSVAQIDLGLR